MTAPRGAASTFTVGTKAVYLSLPGGSGYHGALNIDRIPGMAQTATNVTCTMKTTFLIHRFEGTPVEDGSEAAA
jgi:Na+/H+-dicarboxylate symporter